MRFKLRILSANTELKDAFAQLCEDKQSGLVVATGTSDFRLVNFDHMTEALSHSGKNVSARSSTEGRYCRRSATGEGSNMATRIFWRMHGRREPNGGEER